MMSLVVIALGLSFYLLFHDFIYLCLVFAAIIELIFAFRLRKIEKAKEAKDIEDKPF